MTSLAVKILKDEDGNNFVPYTSTIALYDPDGETISDKIAKKLETSSLIAGTGITLIPDITNHTVEIQSSAPGANLINNLTTSVAGQGALDAYQGYVLNTTKQDTLVSGQNIKTINGSSVLGSGDLTIDTGGNYTAGKGISISNSGEVSVTNPVPDSLRLYNYDIGIKTKAQIESDDTFKKLCYQIAESPWDCILYLYTSGNRDTDNSVKNIIGAYHKTYYTIFGSGTIKAIFTQMNNSANFGITGNQVEIDGCNLSTIQIVIPLDAESQQTSNVTINVGSDINYSVPTYTAGEGIVIDENNVISTTGSGTNNYNNLSNKPSINGVVLEGNKTSEDLGISSLIKTSRIEFFITPNTSRGNMGYGEKVVDISGLNAKGIISLSYTGGSNFMLYGCTSNLKDNPKQLNLYGYRTAGTWDGNVLGVAYIAYF